MFPLLETIDDPAALRRLDRAQLPDLARELRAFLISSVARTGGHLSSNLGTVELAIALHYVFNTPEDRIVWDVGHQTYAHKILTGRRAQMNRLRMLDGPSGFPRRAESRYDTFGTAHSSTSISAALEMRSIPPGMVITLVENALKHGIEPCSAGGKVTVAAALDGDDRLTVSVADTGVGLDECPGQGIGLANIRERLSLLYGDRAHLALEANEPRGFVARIVLPAAAVRDAAAPPEFLPSP